MDWPAGPVLVIGRAGMDLYADPPGARIAQADRFTTALGGSAANIAAGLARQGVRVGLLGCYADDDVGAFIAAQLDAYGIDRRHMRAVSGASRNSLAIVETRMEMGRVLYRNGAADLAFSDHDVAGVDWSAWAVVVTTGTVLASEPARSATLQALQAARDAGLRLVLDIDWRPESWTSTDDARAITARVAAMCDIVVGNDDEFAVLAGTYDSGLDAARGLVAKGAALVVYKMGEKGAVALTPGAEHRSGIWRVDAIKPVGAGDGFLAGLLAGLSAGHEPAAAVLRGAATAAIVVANVGCAPASPSTFALDLFMSTHSHPPET
ncbi:PfkB family carbohydrate kinase [Loktanella sp. DJP18]|uniref:PfkB family carbohydrate kinase n=1 Tax=Loktanella sp. DJP18 TaxID=3409788 RepID=UPI003BB52342